MRYIRSVLNPQGVRLLRAWALEDGEFLMQMLDDADDTFVENIYRFAFATIDPRTERGGDDGRNESGA